MKISFQKYFVICCLLFMFRQRPDFLFEIAVIRVKRGRDNGSQLYYIFWIGLATFSHLDLIKNRTFNIIKICYLS